MSADRRSNISPHAASESDTDGAATDLGAPRIDRAAQDLLDQARSAVDLPPELKQALEEYRKSREYAELYEQKEPLVSICVCTYNRAQILIERCIPSVLAQDYPNFEVVVVGDGCTDDTENLVRRMEEPRIRFVNIPRSRYPDHPFLRWMVAGTVPANYARDIAHGALMTHVDDDDEYLPSRVSKLVECFLEKRAEAVWHPFFIQGSGGQWVTWGAREFRIGQITAGSVLYSAWFNRIPCDPHCYRYLEPADWNLYRKFRDIGARLVRFPEPLLRHYREVRRD